MKEEYKIFMRMVIILVITAFFADIMVYAFYNLLSLLSLSGIYLESLASWEVYVLFLTFLIVTYYIIATRKSFLLIVYIVLYALTSSYLGSLNVYVLISALVLYFTLDYFMLLGSKVEISASIGKKGGLGILLLLVLSWIIYRFYLFTGNEIKSFIEGWISRSTIEIKEFYGMALETILGRLILVSLVIGLSFWVSLEIGRLMFVNTLGTKSIRRDVDDFIKKENESIVNGVSSEDKSLLWGAQIAISLLLYPVMLLLTSAYRDFVGKISLSSKIYILFLLALYTVSLLFSHYITRVLIRMTSLSSKNKPLVFFRGNLSYVSIAKYVVIAILIFVIISFVEGVNPLNILLSAFGFRTYYHDPLSVYILKFNSYELVVNSYVKEVEKLLEILIKLFWG